MDDWFHLSQMSFDINASLALDFEQQAQRTRDALGTNKRTPDADVPAGPIGDAYKRFSALALYLAEAYGRATAGVDYRDGYGRDVRAEAIAFLAKCIDRVICNYSFAEFAADPRGVISRIINAPIFAWNSDIEPVEFDYSPFGRVAFPMQRYGNAYRVPPIIGAFWLLKSNRYVFAGMNTADNELGGFGNDFIYDPQNGFLFLESNLARISITQTGWQDGISRVSMIYSNDWPALWRDYWNKLESERHKFNDKAERARMIQWVVSFIALVSLASAFNAVMSQGLTLANGSKLIVAVDNVPGVDFGDATPVLRIVSRVLSPGGSLTSFLGLDSAQDASGNVADGVTDASGTMDDFSLGFEYGDAPAFDPPVSFDPGGFEWGDFPSFGDIGNPFGDIDLGAGFSSGFDFGAGIDFDPLAVLNTPLDSSLDSLTTNAGNVFGAFDIGSFITRLAQTYVQYDLSRRALEQRGQPAPRQAYATPGTRTLPDGSRVTTRPDGTALVTDPSGRTVTVRRDGQVVTGTAPQGTTFGGLSTPVVVGVAAAGALALLLLMKRKG